jgi:hypothetical protein
MLNAERGTLNRGSRVGPSNQFSRAITEFIIQRSSFILSSNSAFRIQHFF